MELTTPRPKRPDSASLAALQEQIALWDDGNRGVPTPFISSGLFTARNTEHRPYSKEITIASRSDHVVKFRGEELQQTDLSVWMSLINRARQNGTDEIHFSGYSLLKDLGWPIHRDYYKRAKDSIIRLTSSKLQVGTKDEKKAFSGSLIADYGWSSEDDNDDGGSTLWFVRFDDRISRLFLITNATLLEWQTRKAIGAKSTIAQWLHAFYSTEDLDLTPWSMQKLHELSRSRDTLSSFRRNVKNALEKLVKVGYLSKYFIENDTVHITKKMRLVLQCESQLASLA